MFKKPFRVKSNSQLKGSDRKKLRTDMIQQFTNLTEEAVNLILPNKETIFQLKVLVHSGELIIVYCIQKLPIIFEIEKVMYPTCYMLWHVPDLLYTFTTHPQVFPVIAGGADLMLPGVVLQCDEGIHKYGKLNKGDRVAVNLTNNKAPIAVGKAANSSYDMYMCAKRGKCVQVLHYYGDQLSTYGTKLMIPELGPAFVDKSEETEGNPLSTTEHIGQSDNNDSFTSCIDKIKLCSIEGDKVEDIPTEQDIPIESEDSVEAHAELEKENVPVGSTSQFPMSAISMDELLRHCFFKSLRTTVKKVELPLLTSNFYKLHMITACPKGKVLDIKKSSYKKLSNFLDEMVKLNVIYVETLQRGVQCISKVNYTCDLVKDFVDTMGSGEEGAGLTVDLSSTNKSTVPEITEKYTVTAAVLPLFYAYDYKKKEAVTADIVRKVISDYVRVKNLQNPANRKEVVLDETLRSATKTANDVEHLPWDQLISKVYEQMGHSFKVELSSGQVSNATGKLQPIDLQVGTRSGNKKVTLVNNLELYGINVAEFGRECQHGVAASTTINVLPSAKSVQLQIQGNQVTFVGKLLMEKYKIPKRYLRGLENAPKKKK